MAGLSNTFDRTNVSGGFSVNGNHINGNVSFGGSYRDDPDSLQCLRPLKSVNPEDERRRILTVKDQLVPSSYSWILENETFRSWREEDTHHLLWIKGGAGKGKTMMMAGLVDVLSEARNSDDAIAVSYFFCQNSDSELRTVSSIVKGLIHMLAFREKALIHHLKRKYEAGGEDVFTRPNALITLWHVLEAMLRDFHGVRVYLVVDGLDECDDPDFNHFLRLLRDCKVTTPGKIKWLVTSRPHPRIEHIIGPAQDRYMISLEIEAQHVSEGIKNFIDEKIMVLKDYWSAETSQSVRSCLEKNAEGTFLWVALVFQKLEELASWQVENELTNLANLQPDLDSLYDRMMQIVRHQNPDYADLCTKILRTTTLAYRPLRLRELETVIHLPHDLQDDDSPHFRRLRYVIERCGSFILVYEDTIYFVHQSAKDYLNARAGSESFPFDRLKEHTSIAERCLDTLNSCLKDHHFPDPTSLSKSELGEDELRLLSRIAYACSYWIHHTFESTYQSSFKGYIPNQAKLCDLLESRLIAWVHSLACLKEVTACVTMIKALLDIQGFERTNVFHTMQDTYRFLLQNRHIIEESPNQAYTSALLFAPKSSWIRKNYQDHIPKWITLRTNLNDTWDACLVTLVGHSDEVEHVTFSSDGSLLASKSKDCTRLWDTETGKCRSMISHDTTSPHLAFSPDDRVLVTELGHNLELLDTITGSHQIVLVGHTSGIMQFLFAPNSQIFAFADGVSVRLWNISTGSNCGIFELEGIPSWAMDFSHDGKRIAIAFGSEIQVRSVETSDIVATFREHHKTVLSVQFSPDGRLVLSVCEDGKIWLWNHATTKRGKELEGRIGTVKSARFSPDGNLIVSVQMVTLNITESSVIIWETSTGNRVHRLPIWFVYLCSHSEPMFSPDSKVLVTPLHKGAKSWDTTTGKEISTFEASKEETKGPYSSVSKCSNDGKLFAQGMGSNTRIWEVATGDLLRTFTGHSGSVLDLAFSPVGGLIASASSDRTVKLWSLNKGPSTQLAIGNEIAPINNVASSLDGTLTASMSIKDIRLWDLESGSLMRLRDKDVVFPQVGAFSPDNKFLAVGGLGYVLIWETETGSLRHKATELGQSGIFRIAFSPDSRLLKIEHLNGSTRLVENHAGEFKHVRKPPHAESIQSQNSPDGRFFVGLDPRLRTACLWEQQKDTGQAISKFELGGACGVATFSPDSKLIASVSNERFICVWETETGVCLGVHEDTLPCTGVVSFSHDNRFIAYKFGSENSLGFLTLCNGLSRKLAVVYADPVILVTFSPDASIIAAVSGSAILLWETSFGSPTGHLKYDDKRVSDITFLPDRNIVIAGHEDGSIRSWDTNTCVLLFAIRTIDCPPRFSLDSKRDFLWTGLQGFFLDEVLQPRKKSDVSVADNWVLFDGKRVFWLPTEFRPSEPWAWAASGKSLVIGHHSGHLTSVRLDI